MKKLFVTAVMAMGMGCAFAQSDVVANDSVKTDTAKTCPAQSLVALNDTVTTDSAKALVALNDTVTTDSAKALVALNDTVTTDSAKAEATALVAIVEVNDTTTQSKETTETPATCDKEAGEKAIRAFNTMRKITA